MRDAARSGCTAAIILRDLDRNPATQTLNDERTVRAVLEAIERPPELARLVCIPVEELEAWFWSDDAVVKEVGRGNGKAPPSPHLIRKPKEALERLSYTNGGKPRYSTNKNKDLAEKLCLDVCAKACPSFAALRDFVVSVVTS